MIRANYLILEFLRLHCNYYCQMPVDRFFIVSKSGGLIYSYDNAAACPSVEQTLGFPLPFELDVVDGKIEVVYGEQDGIKTGQVLLNYNEHGKENLVSFL